MVYKCTIAGSVPPAAAESNFRPLKRKAGTENLVPPALWLPGACIRVHWLHLRHQLHGPTMFPAGGHT
jgi:hypothetical protein